MSILNRLSKGFLGLWIVLGCARGELPPPARAGDINVKVIERVIYPVDAAWWRTSKWYDPWKDTGTPNRVIVSGEWACVQDVGTVDDPRRGEYFQCNEGWRKPTPR